MHACSIRLYMGAIKSRKTIKVHYALIDLPNGAPSRDPVQNQGGIKKLIFDQGAAYEAIDIRVAAQPQGLFEFVTMRMRFAKQILPK